MARGESLMARARTAGARPGEHGIDPDGPQQRVLCPTCSNRADDETCSHASSLHVVPDAVPLGDQRMPDMLRSKPAGTGVDPGKMSVRALTRK